MAIFFRSRATGPSITRYLNDKYCRQVSYRSGGSRTATPTNEAQNCVYQPPMNSTSQVPTCRAGYWNSQDHQVFDKFRTDLWRKCSTEITIQLVKKRPSNIVDIRDYLPIAERAYILKTHLFSSPSSPVAGWVSPTVFFRQVPLRVPHI